MLSRCTPIFVHSFFTYKISGTPSSLLCSWHLLMEEKKLLAKLHAFALQHTVQYILYTNYVKDKKDIDYNTVYSIHTIITILYNVFLFISWNFFASFVTSLISMVILTDIFNISLFPTVLKVAE